MNHLETTTAPRRTPKEYMTWDHDQLDRIFDDLARMMEDQEYERADHTLGEAIARLHRHLRLEETLLFPLFEERTGLCGPTAILRQEHRALETALESLRVAVEAADAAAFRRAYEAFQSIQPQHELKEEVVLFPALDRALGDDEMAEFASRLASEW
jgi:hemerythrin-like domain-containing protein